MKKSLGLFLVALSLAGTAFASDITQTAPGHKTTLKTDRAAHCGTPSGKTSRECVHTAGAQTSRH